MTVHELTERFGLKRQTIHKYVRRGLLPRPTGYGRWAVYDPSCVAILEQLAHVREQYHATLDELAERRQLTGQLEPPAVVYGRR